MTRLLKDLPANINVYHRIGLGNSDRLCNVETAGECCEREGRMLPLFLNLHLQDGLWASRAAIGYWKSYPYCHPHYTLFEALYTHLTKN